MAALKMGARLKSTVCEGEIMVVIAPDAELEMTCGGAAMVDAGEAVTPSGEVLPDHAVGVAMGKRSSAEQRLAGLGFEKRRIVGISGHVKEDL